jgi:hypothetical protein
MSSTAASISTPRPSPITAALARAKTEDGEGRIEEVEGKRTPPTSRSGARPPRARRARWNGNPLGPRRARLASRMLGDGREAAGLPLRHPHRRHRSPRNPPPQRDRAEPGLLRLRRAGEAAQRRAHLDAQQFPDRTQRQDEQEFGRIPAPATADRPRLPPARLPDDVPAGALPQRAGIQLGRAGRGADAAEADGDAGGQAQGRSLPRASSPRAASR